MLGIGKLKAEVLHLKWNSSKNVGVLNFWLMVKSPGESFLKRPNFRSGENHDGFVDKSKF